MTTRGLVLSSGNSGPKLAYGWEHGFGNGWLPYWIQTRIVHFWNPLACRIWGHDWIPDFSTAEWSHQLTHKMPHDFVWTACVCSSCTKRCNHDH